MSLREPKRENQSDLERTIIGQVEGESRPSRSGVEYGKIIGELKEDYSIKRNSLQLV
jgi:hypothetical protein